MSKRPSRNKRTPFSIMNPAGFGDLTIKLGGYTVTLPSECMTKDGAIKPFIKAKLSELTVQDATKLNQLYGVTVETV